MPAILDESESCIDIELLVSQPTHFKPNYMLKVALKDEIKRIVSPLWLLINQTRWNGSEDEYDAIKAAAMSIIANMAYCDVSSEERKNAHRAKVVPSVLFQEIIRSEKIDFPEAMRSLDFPDITFLRTKRYVAAVIGVRDLILVGVRGTQFAYDWKINLKILTRPGELFGMSARFHAGFLKDAEELSVLIEEYILQRYSAKSMAGEKMIYFSGHSLGGAIAAILRHMRIHVSEQIKWPPDEVSASDCYVFGSPRVGRSTAMLDMQQPNAIRRYLDIVPYCPPKLIGYRDFQNQLLPKGSPYLLGSGPEFHLFGLWIVGLAFKKFLAEHSMEQYRRDAIEAIINHPKIKQYWKYEQPHF
jgi:hypothetical protein